jgi:hypothetical protein
MCDSQTNLRRILRGETREHWDSTAISDLLYSPPRRMRDGDDRYGYVYQDPKVTRLGQKRTGLTSKGTNLDRQAN